MEGLFVDLFLYIFSKHKYRVTTLFNLDEYYKATYQLSTNDISYRTRIKNMEPFGSAGGIGYNTQYDIYVKKRDRYVAEKALSGSTG
ncbi:hypothetical protein SD70_14310 [Gordoniibacillus kamchatkensis]|uniref:Uncharacterized protein n=1 Tax=Gordoniibacillus kamchatkensis TaxID=1590651 RepID=A0ABR5AGV1_9BACL|nr:hypothetical protein SD70_14310 [Paenibacillus sp. VKM B-2647]